MDPAEAAQTDHETIEILGLVAEDLDSLCTMVNRGAHRTSGRSRAIRLLSTAIADLKEVQLKLFPESKVTRRRRTSPPKEGDTQGDTK